MKRSNLTDKQRRFAEEYCRDFNATQAAIRAGYSEGSAASIGHENLRKPEIKVAIDTRLEQLSMGADEVLLRLTEQARGLYARFLRPDGTVDLKGLMEAGLAHLVKGTKLDAQGNLQVEFHDAQAALLSLAKVRGLFVKRVKIEEERPDPAAIAERLRAKLPKRKRRPA